MKEHLGSILHPSTLEPLFGKYFGPVQIDNSKEYNAGLFSRFRSVDSVLVDILSEKIFLELRIYSGKISSGASLLLWDRKTGNVQEFETTEKGTSSFIKQGSFKDGYWSFTRSDKRFNFRLDDTIRQGYTHSAVWEKHLNFQLDALTYTGEKKKGNWFTKISPSGKDWIFENHSPHLSLEGQLSWNDLSVSLENGILAYTVRKGYSSEVFSLENRIYLEMGPKKKIHIYNDDEIYIWGDGEVSNLGSAVWTSEGKRKIVRDQNSKLELVLEPELEASFFRPNTFRMKNFIKTLYTVSGWIKTKSKKEKVTDGIAILEKVQKV
ncbi:DUF2804 domain-containing protein [Leptospira dzoumogneensis]|uniref:DUF2804 domain-containing protein n=1 Tax=Leptospira dzoumogneensis TaxID=2484904 RepID=A0A4Z1ANU6_9LEPT|nr:DUF2804 domain-containing protein [Leptospira dzoumogneensis]TGM99486.1 DUF2804 domain-containing protein [Leptospira dzoumogneensis]